MQVAEIQDMIEKEPFRPFAVRLNNGVLYAFNARRELGATQDYSIIYYFGPGGGSVRIDRDSIVEIIE